MRGVHSDAAAREPKNKAGGAACLIEAVAGAQESHTEERRCEDVVRRLGDAQRVAGVVLCGDPGAGAPVRVGGRVCDACEAPLLVEEDEGAALTHYEVAAPLGVAAEGQRDPHSTGGLIEGAEADVVVQGAPVLCKVFELPRQCCALGTPAVRKHLGARRRHHCLAEGCPHTRDLCARAYDGGLHRPPVPRHAPHDVRVV